MKAQGRRRTRTERMLDSGAQVACPLGSKWRCRRSGLFVAQGLDGVECGCTIGGVKPESDPDGGTDNQPGDCPAIGEDHIHFEPKREQIAPDHAQNNAKNSTGLGNEYRLSEELPEDIAAACTNRFAHTNLLRAFRHAHQHDVHDANTGSYQGNETDYEGANADHASNIEESAFERIIRVNLEIIILICLQA